MALARLDVELRALFDQLGSDLHQVVGLFEESSAKIEEVQKKIAEGFNNVFITTGIPAVRELLNVVGELGEKFSEIFSSGQKLQGISDAFTQLGGSAASIEEATKATLGLVSSTDLMQVSNQALLRGYTGINEQLPLITQAATKFAIANNQDVLPSIERLTSALELGKVKGLQQFLGVMDKDTAVVEFGRLLGLAGNTVGDFTKQLDQAGIAAALSFAAIQKMAIQASETGPPTDTVTIAFKALKTALEEAIEKFGQVLNQNPQLVTGLRDLGEAVAHVDWKAFGEGMTGILAPLAQVVSAIASMVSYLNDMYAKVKLFEEIKGQFPDTFLGVLKLGFGSGESSAISSGDDAKSALALMMKAVAPGINDALSSITPAAETKISGMGPLSDGSAYGAELSAQDTALEKKSQYLKDIADKAGKAQDAWDKLFEETQKKNLTQSITQDIKTGDLDSFWKQITDLETMASSQADDMITKLRAGGAQISDQDAQTWKDSFIMNLIDPLTQKLTDSVQKAQGELDKLNLEVSKKNIEEQLNQAIKTGNTAGVNDLLAQLSGDAGQQIQAQLTKIGQALPEGSKPTPEQTAAIVALYQKNAIEPGAQKLQDHLKTTFEQSANDFQQLFTQAFSGTAVNFSDILKQVAIGFASQLAASMFNIQQAMDNAGIKGGLNPSSAGKYLGSLLSGAFGDSGGGDSFGPLADASAYAGLLGGASGTSGIGPVADASTYAAMLGSSGGGGGYGAAAQVGIGQLNGLQSILGGNSSSIAVGAGLALATGGLSLLAPGGGTSLFGGGGPQNADTIARNSFGSWLTGKLPANGAQLTDGSWVNSGSFNLDSSQFNKPGWANDLNSKYGGDATSQFGAIGAGLQSMLGLAQNVGPQIGAILETALNGKISNAQLLFQQLGVTAKQMTDALVQAAEKGDATWQQAEGAITAVNQGFTVAQGNAKNLGQDYQNLANSGDKGIAAIQAIKQLSADATAAGVKNGDQFIAMLEKQGVAADQAQKLDQAFKNSNFANFAAVMKGSNQDVGTIAANFANLGGTFKDVSANADSVVQNLKNIPTSVTSDININVHTNLDANTQTAINNGIVSQSTATPAQVVPSATGTAVKKMAFMALGGVVDGPSLLNSSTIIGEAGPEAVMPLTRIGGKLGVVATGNGGGHTINIHVDATNAYPGAEHDIVNAILSIKDQIKEETISAVLDEGLRGGGSGSVW